MRHILIILSLLLLSSPLFGQSETKVVEKTEGLFVSVGDPGTILTSPDGNSWTKRSSGTSKYLGGVTYSQ